MQVLEVGDLKEGLGHWELHANIYGLVVVERLL